MKREDLKDPFLWTLLAVDLLPAAGYFLGWWRVVDLVFLFWAETVVLFLVALATALTGAKPLRWVNIFWGFFLGGWFILIFLMLTCGMDPRLSGEEKNWPYLAVPRLLWEDKVWPQILIFSILHWAGFFTRLVERARLQDQALAGKEASRELQQDLAEPVQRIVILFFSMFLGVFASKLVRNFDGVFFLLLGLKAWFDLYAYLKPAPPAATP